MTLWRNLDMSERISAVSLLDRPIIRPFPSSPQVYFLGTTIKMQLIMWKNLWRIKDSLYLYG